MSFEKKSILCFEAMDVSLELDVHTNSLYHWVHEVEE